MRNFSHTIFFNEMKQKTTILLFIVLALLNSFCSQQNISRQTPSLPTVTPMLDDTVTSEQAIRFLEAKIKNDPEDMISYNLLAGRYLQRLRETGSVEYLDLATRVVEASLKVLPEEHNSGGLGLLAEVEYASHNFTSALEHAKKLMTLDPGKVYPYQIMGDANLELGNYEKAATIYKNMIKLNDGSNSGNVAIETRLARLELLYGNFDEAQKHLVTALSIASKMPNITRENIAWQRWQLGEIAFSRGDYAKAESYYQDSLTTYPNYFRSCASLGRVKAARGDIQGAIKDYKQAVDIIPDPIFIAALGDLYKLSGLEKEANAQYALVEQIAKLNKLNGVLYNRNLAIFYADHDLKLEEAYTQAEKEYEIRKDIYGADAVAWTALKTSRLPEAQTAIKGALRLGTKDAKLFYHAGMIANAAKDKKTAIEYLQKALTLNPKFDPLQSTIAEKNLIELKSSL